jgi:16S rRNA (guanine527-N7)-methyltransferase
VTTSDKAPVTAEVALADLVSRAERLGVALGGRELAQIESYCQLVLGFNKHTNLVSCDDLPTLLREHIVDAVSLVAPAQAFLATGARRLIDVGSGAGFPALVLAILLEDLQADLVESVGKKCKFLVEAVEALGLANRVRIHTERAEVLAHDKSLREHFQLGTVRAVGTVALVAELVLPFLSCPGLLLAPKSVRQTDYEVKEALSTIGILGGRLEEPLVPPADVLSREGVVIRIRKVSLTPSEYPRHSSKLKQPIA